MKKRTLFILFLLVMVAASQYASAKNLHKLVSDDKVLNVYLADFLSESEKITPESIKGIFADTLSKRNKERFVVVTNKEQSDIYVDCKITAFKYLEKDPVDHLTGGTYGLIVDAMVSQNYAQVQLEVTVFRTKDMKKLWYRKDAVSVTQTNMPEPDSIPKTLKECAKRFIFECFGKKRR